MWPDAMCVCVCVCGRHQLLGRVKLQNVTYIYGNADESEAI